MTYFKIKKFPNKKSAEKWKENGIYSLFLQFEKKSARNSIKYLYSFFSPMKRIRKSLFSLLPPIPLAYLPIEALAELGWEKLRDGCKKI